ncbi:MAG: methionyl-tRNA formyltransferase [Myxococcota bacterium]|jgi:methionyl-tRNA formyltransferase|nr:methionyl-tRNA formyltransferase [Myxococcota bacterium]
MGLRIALFGQAPFGRDVAIQLAEAGHELVAVHVPPDARGRVDPLAAESEERGWPLYRHKAYRRKGIALAERVDEYRSHQADLNVLAFTTVILPPEIVEGPRLGSLCFHPSLLPAFRGGNALAWQIIEGAEESGVTVFRPDEGVDTGPIVIQKGGVSIGPGATSASLYFDELYPLGIEAMTEAVAAVADGSAAFTPQSAAGASFQGLVDDEVARIDWSRPGEEIDRLIRGCDPQPAAWTEFGGETYRLFGCVAERGAHGAEPGTVLEVAPEGPMSVAGAGEIVLRISRVRGPGGKKVSAGESGLSAGDVLA